jgi:phosphate starvation-inducible PhoH-like protein
MRFNVVRGFSSSGISSGLGLGLGLGLGNILFRNFNTIIPLLSSKPPLQYWGGGVNKQRCKHTLSMRTKKNIDFSSDLRCISPVYKPRSDNQSRYVKFLCDKNIPIVIGVGPAGSGKTLFACNQAVIALKSGAVDKIILTRPVVPVEEDIGFLPGSLINKMDPWTRPIFDILLEFYQQKDIDGMLHSGALEISPLAYMRGRTFKKAFVIADEMQNSSPNQMLMLTTRIGDGSKMVITGDLKQSDRGVDNGLADLMRKIKYYETLQNKLGNNNINNELGIRIIEMVGADIQRSPIVAKILDIYSYVKPCGNPNVSHHAPSLSVNVGDSDLVRSSGSVGGVSDVGCDENDKSTDWSIGVETVIKPTDIVGSVGSVKNDIFIDNISDSIPDEIQYKKINCDAALTPLYHTKSKHFPKDIIL